MPPHDREHFEQALFQPAAAPAQKRDNATFGWSHPPRSCDAETVADPMARLEWLDDLMFAAIDGDPVALDCAADAWHKSLDDLGDAALEESRVQYLHRARRSGTHCATSPIIRHTRFSRRSRSSRCWRTSRDEQCAHFALSLLRVSKTNRYATAGLRC